MPIASNPDPATLGALSSSHTASSTPGPPIATPAKSFLSLDRPHFWLAIIAIPSALLRFVLVLRGGQYYWPDEGRILRTWVVLKRPGETLDYILHVGPLAPSHWFYTFLAIPFALVQALYMRLRGIPLNTETVKSNLWVMALGTCLFSVACIILVYMVARRAGASEYESLAAALFMATATSIFYYSRHLFSYDAGMALALLALWIGLKPGPLSRSFVCGLVAGLAFSAYNGYWTIAALAIVAHVLYSRPTVLEFFKRSLVAGAALVLPYAILELLTRLRGLPSYTSGMVGIAGIQTMGSFSEGWKFPALYLWDSERLTAIVWLLLALVAVLAIRRAWLWLALAAGAYLLLALASHAHVFVVYGRTARQLVPFLCLAAAYGLAKLPKPLSAAVVVLVAAQFAVNIAVPFRQQFPPSLPPGQPHPLAWRPYQYEGFTPEQRAAFRAGDYSWWFARGTK